MPVAQNVVDEQLKALQGFDQWFTKKEIKYLPEVLNAGETIFGITSGVHDGSTWLIVATDKRMLFLDKGMLYGLKQLELPLTQISGIGHSTGIMFGQIEVASSGGKQKIETIAKKDVVRFADILSRLVERARTPQRTQDGGTPAVDVTTQLERLASLRDRGVLTDEEFRAQKAKLLT